jgi:hypothetical protein
MEIDLINNIFFTITLTILVLTIIYYFTPHSNYRLFLIKSENI